MDSGGLEYFGWLVESGGLLVNWWTLLEAGGPWWSLVDSGGLSWTGELVDNRERWWTMADSCGPLWLVGSGGLVDSDGRWWTLVDSSILPGSTSPPEPTRVHNSI